MINKSGYIIAHAKTDGGVCYIFLNNKNILVCTRRGAGYGDLINFSSMLIPVKKGDIITARLGYEASSLTRAGWQVIYYSFKR